MKYFSCFSGIGGFELGITQAYDNRPDILNMTEILGQNMPDSSEREVGITCVGFSEIDKYATQIYQSHFPNHPSYGDITKIDTATLPDFDCLVGGFPCQSFSIAGKRKGFEDTRGTLFFELARILEAKKPRLFLFENVKGLISHDNGKTFAIIITTLDELGYDVQWQVLNSKNHGVPQNRERVFIIGHLRGTPRPKVFPLGEISGLSTEGNGSRTIASGISPAVTSNLKRGVHNGGEAYISKTIRGGGRGSPHGSKQNWDSYEYEGRIRRLTPTECERLQGFPDGWTEGVSDTQRYKCLGNAVTVNVIRDIFIHLL